MSHFSVLVFTQNNSDDDFDSVDDLLWPFSEENTVEYDGEQEVKERFEKKRAELEQKIATPLISYETFLELRAEMGKGNETDEEKADNERVYAEVKAEYEERKEWCEGCLKEYADFEAYRQKQYDDNIEKNNGRIVLNCNPNAKWDWCSIGGRWTGLLPLKTGGTSNTCLASEVDWDKFKSDCDSEHEKEFGEGCDWAERFLEEPLHKADWVARYSQGSFAILSRDGWKARARCGWFGTSYDECPLFDYWAEIKRLVSIPNIRVTVVDCHT